MFSNFNTSNHNQRQSLLRKREASAYYIEIFSLYEMPRLRPSLLIKAFTEYPLLVLLLRECRDLPSARNELRWLNEHAKSISAVKPQASTCLQHHSLRTQMTLQDLCRRRSRGEPLQYLIGNQPFGDLEILCRKNVLIPRYKTRPVYHGNHTDTFIDPRLKHIHTMLPT